MGLVPMLAAIPSSKLESGAACVQTDRELEALPEAAGDQSASQCDSASVDALPEPGYSIDLAALGNILLACAMKVLCSQELQVQVRAVHQPMCLQLDCCPWHMQVGIYLVLGHSLDATFSGMGFAPQNCTCRCLSIESLLLPGHAARHVCTFGSARMAGATVGNQMTWQVSPSTTLCPAPLPLPEMLSEHISFYQARRIEDEANGNT